SSRASCRRSMAQASLATSACGAGSGSQGGRNIETHRLETMNARRMEPQPFDVGASHRPLQTHVDREPRQLFGQYRLPALVEPVALGTERELAPPDQYVIDPRVPVKGEVRRARA